MTNNDRIYVTQPSLPPLEEFIPYLEELWDNKTLTNGGKFHQELEKELCNYLGVKYISLFNNGTIALVAALKALNLSGEVITTPYSFIATSHSLIWNNLKPIFADIDPKTMNLNPNTIEALITSKTTAIMPVHCYGLPCDVFEIQKIAKKYDLKVIYDAAHAFGVFEGGKSLLSHGDMSILSFHATKVFNTFEGGAVICDSLEMKTRIDSIKNFGYVSETEIDEVGLNGKMSEVNAAFGLLQLKYADLYISQRKKIDETYRAGLKQVKGISFPSIPNGLRGNYSYFPIIIEESFPITRDDLHKILLGIGVVSRKYFHPLIPDFSYYQKNDLAQPSNYPWAIKVSSQVLCLPIYPNLSMDKVSEIISTVLRI